MASAEWLDRRRAELLPVPYFHAVFTLPHELNPIAHRNRRLVFGLLFRTVAETLQTFAADPKRGLGGRLGFTTILHTWDQKLLDHIHLHCLIPAGALSFDGGRWIPARTNFLFSVRALSRLFRGKFIDALTAALSRGELILPHDTDADQLRASLWHKDWIVYCRPPFHRPERTLDYLGRYTHRVAIANHRIIKIEDGHVTFRYRDRRQGRVKTLTITTNEFIRRFLLHILPDGFMRIRHYGFLANRSKNRGLQRCRELLGLPSEPPEIQAHTSYERIIALTGIDRHQCPCCNKGQMRCIAELNPLATSTATDSAPRPVIYDSS
jgi:hypothetical protein